MSKKLYFKLFGRLQLFKLGSIELVDRVEACMAVSYRSLARRAKMVPNTTKLAKIEIWINKVPATPYFTVAPLAGSRG